MSLSKQSLKKFKRIVVKIGSSLLYSSKAKLDQGFMTGIAAQIASLVGEKKEIVIVSSGAIALGMSVLGLTSRPKELSHLQAAASVGQLELMDAWRDYLKKRQVHCGQVLLTWEDFDSRERYLNARNTLSTLLKMGVVPVINENDAVSTDEIKFGDNDRLSAMVATLIDADLLIILSDVDGLLQHDKKTVVRFVDHITHDIRSLACPTTKQVCVGGMVTKIDAAKISVDSGIPCVIANGRRSNIISLVMDFPQEYGTLFAARSEHLVGKKRWMAVSAKPKGTITADEGAVLALRNKKSLLSVGIMNIEGSFSVGDIVSVIDVKGRECARGKIEFGAKQLEAVKGAHLAKAVIHRNHLVVL